MVPAVAGECDGDKSCDRVFKIASGYAAIFLIDVEAARRVNYIRPTTCLWCITGLFY